jgi:4-hydroxy-2-oxoheptanedioate aldolase
MNIKKIEGFRRKLKDAKCYGIFSKTTDSGMVEAAGHSGLDFIILDQEHGPIGQETLHNHVRAADFSPIVSIVRVNGHDYDIIGSALDSGAYGVQVPNISTSEQARAVVAAAKYHPLGSRGVCRFVRAADYGIRERGEYIADANRALVVLQVEGLEGISNLDTILDVEGFDVLFVGPYDLSQSVGRPGLVDHSEVLELISTIAEKSRRKGVALGSFADTPEALRRQAAMGFTYLSYGVDQNLFLQACSEIPSLDH